jgi:molybdopterin molybdotransferase
VPVENSETAGAGVRILQALVRPGENIRPVGSDMLKGEHVLGAGVRLSAPDLGLLASLGHAEVEVGRQPRVAVFSTGDEIVAPEVAPGPGQIRDANRFTLDFAVKQAGGCVVLNAHVPDDEEALRAAFAQALEVADVIITSGGVSMGDRDLVKALLGEFAEVHFRRVFMKPGKPLNFATAGDKLIFGLPGNPVSCLVAFHMFARPALSILEGAPAPEHATVTVLLANDVQPSDRIEYQRAHVASRQDGRLSASTTGPQQSSRLQSFVGANGFLVVPPGEDRLAAGSVLDAILFAPPFGAPAD